jgi:hypothetical protein
MVFWARVVELKRGQSVSQPVVRAGRAPFSLPARLTLAWSARAATETDIGSILRIGVTRGD